MGKLLNIWQALKGLPEQDKRSMATWADDDDRFYLKPFSIMGGQDPSGIAVDNFSSMNFSAVFNAITIISQTIASLPLHLYRDEAGTRVKAVEHPQYSILHKVGNQEMTPMTVRETSQNAVLGWGGSFAWKEWSSGLAYRLNGLWPIEPHRVQVMRSDKGNRELFYRVQQRGREHRDYPRSEILHIPGLGYSGTVGYSILTLARRGVSQALALEEFGSRFFGDGTHPGMVATHPHKLDPETHENLKKSLTSAVGGLGKSHRLLLLEEGMKVENISIPPEEAQFLRSRIFSVQEIARWFNIPSFLLSEHTHSTYSNIAELMVGFAIHCISPWCRRIEEQYDLQLLNDQDRRAGYGWKHGLEGLLRGSPAVRSAFYKEMVSTGIMSINECRKLENLPDVPGGDAVRVPMSSIVLE